MFKKLSKVALTSVLVGVTTLAVGITPVSATGSHLVENFNHNFKIKAESPHAKLYGIVWGVNGRAEARSEFPASIKNYKKFGKEYVGLKLKPAASNGTTFFLSELADLRTGFERPDSSYWLPTVGHPVTMVTKVKFSENYAGGTANGSAGVWLWNSPFCDACAEPFIPTEALGFSWDRLDSALPGLHFDVIQGNFPVFFQPIDVNMSEWNTYKLKWKVNNAGVQSVEYFINGTKVGETELATPMPPLNLEMWVDNQFYTYEGTVVYQDIVETQQMFVDYVKVKK